MAKKKSTDGNNHLLVNETNFSVIESYKAIRANINFTVTAQGCKKIMVCSPHSGEGKSTTCVNLAITIAQTGASVLLIDCDLRRPSVHKLLKINNDVGMSHYLSNMLAIPEIVKETNISYLNVITAGVIPPNPSELLASPKIGELFEEIEKRFIDYIIIDTAPICIVSDVLPMSKLCNGVILIVNHMETKHPSIKEALEKLNFAGANVVGMILNKIKIKHNYKSYKNYYGKYNDEDEN